MPLVVRGARNFFYGGKADMNSRIGMKLTGELHWRIGMAALLAAWLQTAVPETCAADAPTLFKWSYGAGGEGGPNLDEPLVTDRPDTTESSSTVGMGVVQLEAGYTYTYDSDDDGSFKSHSFPETLLRVGALADWLELRVNWNYVEETTTDFGASRDVATGSEDLGLGVKLGLTGQEGILPEIALIADMSVPSGSSDFTAGETLPAATWCYGWDLNDWLATGAITRFGRALDDVTGEPYLEVTQSWTLNMGLGDRVGSYAEWFAFIPDGADTNHTEHYFNGGFTLLITNNLQLDVRAGVGLNDAADDYFTGTGFAIRL
jgi:hypothetical protein